MSYELYFHPAALKEWNKLSKDIQSQFKKVIQRRLLEPHSPSARLGGGLANCYKIKLRKLGYRLVYHVEDKKLHVVVIAVGKRNKDQIYKLATNRNTAPIN